MSISICDILNDAQTAQTCGLCSGTPSNCGNIDPAVCLVSNSANADMQLFAIRYSPTGALDPTTTKASEQALMYKKAQNNLLLKAAYPAAEDVDIKWYDFHKCGLNRSDALTMGMSPVWPIGGKKLYGDIWKVENHNDEPAPIPLLFDYIMNPDLVILMFILIIVIFVGYILIAYRKKIYNYITTDN